MAQRLFLLSTLAALAFALPAYAQMRIAPGEARAIAKEAYIYGFPMVDNYRIQHSYFVDRSSPEYKAPYNRLVNISRVYTPEDKAVQTPNSDTPYSWLGLDLRAEPIVITVPRIDASRYWSVQLIDLYTHNFDYLGTRTTGNGGGSFLIAGPGWKGATPKGITKVIRCETEIATALFRTQLFDPGDLDNVKKIQARYIVQPLSAFTGGAAPKAAQPIDFVKPLTPAEQKTSLEFFNRMNFLLQFAPLHPSERDVRARFARIGVAAGKTLNVNALSPEMKKAMTDGMADAMTDFEAVQRRIAAGELTSADYFGTRSHLNNNYLYRMAGALVGIYGNSKEEALYLAYSIDTANQPLDGSANRYTLRFAPGQLPPVGAFWSLTVYELPSGALSVNPINRYLINSPMLPGLARDADGGLTFYVQNDSPEKERQSNWLPAPKGPFFMVMRLYLPKPQAFDGQWKQPPLQSSSIATQTQGMVKVTPDTYIRAETDRAFHHVSAQAGGVNRCVPVREPTPLDQQGVVRMNRDTLYMACVVDTSKGATITVPPIPDRRFVSAELVDNDHYCPAVYYGPGTYELPRDTKYLYIIVRIQLFNSKDKAEIALVNRLQDAIVIKANSADPLPPMQWEATSLQALTEKYVEDQKQYPNFNGMMGPRGKVDEKTRHIAAAAGWGLNPEWDATYLTYSGGQDYRVCHKATYTVPENQAFWSITVYGSDGYMKNENVIVNSSNVKLNGDGTFTVYFGSKETCGNVPNRLDVTEGWNFMMRIYRPGPAVLDGRYELAKAEPMK